MDRKHLEMAVTFVVAVGLIAGGQVICADANELLAEQNADTVKEAILGEAGGPKATPVPEAKQKPDTKQKRDAPRKILNHDPRDVNDSF